MALHKDLPIYKVAYDLLGEATELARNMPRDVKSLLGAKLRDECLEVTLSIARANRSRDKTPHLTALLERVETTELLLRLSRDKRFIPTSGYARAIALTNTIGKQANGWRKHYAASPAV